MLKDEFKPGDVVVYLGEGKNYRRAFMVVEYPARINHSPWTLDHDLVSIDIRGVVKNVPKADVIKLDTRGLSLGDKVKVVSHQSFDHGRECMIGGVLIDPADMTKSRAIVKFLDAWASLDEFNDGSRNTFNWTSLTKLGEIL